MSDREAGATEVLRPPRPARPGKRVREDAAVHDPGDTEENEERLAAGIQSGEGEDDSLDASIIEDADVEITLPVITGGRVVYLGNNPKRSKSMVGTMTEERWEDDDGTLQIRKEPAMDTGIQNYDFSSRDNRGRLLPKVLVSQTASPRLRDKPIAACEHPEHLRRFLRIKDAAGRKEFEVLVTPRTRARVLFERYVMDKDRAEGKNRMLADFAQGTRQSPE